MKLEDLAVNQVHTLVRTVASKIFKAAGVLLFLFLTAGAVAQGWVQTSAPITNWVSVACSADGQQIVAAVGEYVSSAAGSIYISTNGGVSWVLTAAPVANWASVVASADGSTLVAGTFNFPPDPLYISTNAGITWDTIALNAANEFWGNWASVACSADAKTIAVGSADLAGEAYGSQIFLTTNSAASWTYSRLQGYPISLACSRDGSTMLAGFDAAAGLYLLISTDFGGTWNIGPNGMWYSVACSGDGTTMLAPTGRGGAGTIFLSRDRGGSWIQVTAPGVMASALTLSTDGKEMVAVAKSSGIFSSRDSGLTWKQDDAPLTNWSSVASSADGCKLIAAVNGGGIYTWQSTPTPVLNIKPSGANLLLSWTVPSMNFVLQESPDLTTGIWSNVTAIRTLSYSNLQYQVSLPAPEGGWFFRLISP